MIYRELYKDISKALTYFPVVAILGPRQVGKTTLLNELKSSLAQDSILLDLERESDKQKLQEAELFLSQQKDKTVYIDEIPLMPSLIPLIRWLVDQDRRAARFVITGSASLDLIKSNTETLAGRIAYFNLLPFSLKEVSDQKSIFEHWYRGGFYGSLFAPDDELSHVWMDSFIETYLQRDIRRLGYEISIPAMNRLLRVIASIHGNVLQIEPISKNLGISVNTIKKYLDILEGSFIIRRLEPYYINTTKRLVKAPKIYIRDSGLLHRLSGIQSLDQLYGHILLGHSWESYVIEEILKSCGKKFEYYIYRAHTGAEIDLILKGKDDLVIAIEIKHSTKTNPSKGFYSAVEDVKANKKYIIVPEGDGYTRSDHVMVGGLKWVIDELEKL